jgi:arylsulfatase A-like enzyme/Flp pilus assembly protein TadD
MNLLLVTIDTLRADRLGCYGYDAADTDAIDGLAERGVLFEDASTTATTTLPAHVSLLSGRWVHEHGVDSNNDVVPRSLPLVSDTLASAGYATAAFVSGRPLARHAGLASHFGHYDDTFPDALGGTRFPSERRAAHTVDAATEWLTVAEEPFFAWVHLYDPHAPRTPTLPAADPYDAEVRDVDAAVGDLLAALQVRGLTDNMAIVLVADHGESLGAHGEETHGVFLYQETLRVPLIVAAPGVSPSRRTDPVSVVDVAPTLLGLAAAGGPASSGASLLHAAPSDRILYASTVHGWERYGWAPLQALRRGSVKAIEAPRREVYDLAVDSAEQKPSRSSSSHGLFSLLPESTVAPAATDPELAAQLVALGYAASAPLDPEAAPDPKDHARWLPAMEQAGAALHEGRPADAERLLRPVVKADPNNPAALNDLGMALARLGRGAEAVEILQRAVERTPTDATVWTNLGYAAGVEGDLPTARAAYEQAAALAPSFAVPCLNRAALELRAGDRVAARRWVDEALKRDPHMAEAVALRAELGAP